VRAMIIRSHGELDRVVYDERFPDPPPGPGEVIVAVRATSLNYHDVFTLRGMPGIKIPMPAIIGLDLAGEVTEIGDGVEGWAVGDRVLVDPIDRVRGGLMGETIHGASVCTSSSAFPTVSVSRMRRPCRWPTAPRTG
jgi:alcohol dehydrogenase